MSNSSQWHQWDTDAALGQLGTSEETGLGTAEALRRLSQYGPNELQAADTASAWSILLEQFKNVLIVILLVAVVLSLILGETVEAIAIAVIVMFAAVLGFVQEYRAERALEALRELAAPTAEVIRDGDQAQIPSGDIVPGDIVLLRTGDKVPADSRLIQAANLKVDEAALTGESVSVEKQTRPIESEGTPLADRTNMVYAGTAVTYGRGRAVVVETGMHTEFGRIAGLLTTIERSRTPLQDNLDQLGGVLTKTALGVVILIAGVGVVRGLPPLEMLIFGIALAVAVVPEALPAVVTISLAIGVQRMAKRNSLVRRLPAVETLGSVTVICSDKTGTLTRDEMTVRRVFTSERLFTVSGAGYSPEGGFSVGEDAVEPAGSLRILLEGGALASDASLVQHQPEDSDRSEFRWVIRGDPTEGALVVAAAKAGLHKSELDSHWPRIHEIPFSSETKRMTTVHREPSGRRVAYTKGAPEIVLESCTRLLKEDGTAPLSQEGRVSVLREAGAMADDALRVLALAYKPDSTSDDYQQDLTFVGLFGMIDSPRPEAKAAIATCRHAGIRAIMITGDHPTTAGAIGRELGLLTDGGVVTGPELDAMSDSELERQLPGLSVFARVSPEHKLRIVSILQAQGECVAMTGDGINDAPALRKADVGIAMGIAGTDVTREAADMTLTDDNFASIIAAVEEGRGVYDNIKKYLMYLLSSNLGEILLLAVATLLGWPIPLSAVQILYVNLATDGLPAVALAVDPPDPDLMDRRPRNARSGIFTRPIVTLMVVGGCWSGAVNLALFHWALVSGRSLEESMTMVFICLILIQFFKAYSYRSDRRSVLFRPFANKWLNLAIVWELILLGGIIYVPFLQRALGTFELPARDWIIVTACSLSVLPVLEFAKWMGRRVPAS